MKNLYLFFLIFSTLVTHKCLGKTWSCHNAIIKFYGKPYIYFIKCVSVYTYTLLIFFIKNENFLKVNESEKIVNKSHYNKILINF